MKNLFLVFAVFLLWTSSAIPHGISHDLYEPEDNPELSRDQQGSPSGKSFTQPAIEKTERWWGASLSTGWTSREIHYGVDETGNYGAYTTELAIRVEKLTLSVWSGFGTGNDYQEWDFTAAYTFEIGPVFFTPGYNFYYQPGVVEHEHSEPVGHQNGHHEEHGQHEHGQGQEPHEHSLSEEGHSHGTYGNEIFFVLGTTAIPYVRPNILFVSDLNNGANSFLEIRLDGEIPLYRDIFFLEPCALLGLNLGYNTTDYYGWNQFQFGLRANWKINRIISIYGGVNYSVAMTALETIDQGNVVWANAGVTFTY